MLIRIRQKGLKFLVHPYTKQMTPVHQGEVPAPRLPPNAELAEMQARQIFACLTRKASMEVSVPSQATLFFCTSEVILGFKGKSKQKWAFPLLFVALPGLFSCLLHQVPRGAGGCLAAAASACPGCGAVQRDRDRGASQGGESRPRGCSKSSPPKSLLQEISLGKEKWPMYQRHKERKGG